MDDFKFTPDEVQPISSNDDLGFSFTPDSEQPDFAKLQLSDIKTSNDPVGDLTQSAKSILNKINPKTYIDAAADATASAIYKAGKSLIDNKEIVGEYIKKAPVATVGFGVKLAEATKSFYKGVESKLEEEELYQFQGDTKLSALKEGAKALGNEAFVVTPKIASEITYWLSKNMTDPDGKDNMISEGFAGLSTMFNKFSNYMGNVDLFKSTAINLPSGRMSWGNFGEAGGHGIGQGVVMGTTARLFGPKFAYGIYAMAGGASVFKESYEKEGDLGKANTLGTVTAATTYALDRWINPLPENIAKGAKITVKEILKDIPKSAAKEIPTETLQQVLSENLVRKIGIDAEQELYEGLAEVAISAAFGGASMAAAGGIGGYIADRSYEKAKEKAIERGATESEIEQYKDATMEKFKNHADVFDAKFQANAEKAFNDLNTFIEQNGSEEEVRKAVEKKQQLEKIYNDTYNELKNIMPEQEAKSNAALIRNSAFFYANEFGISPEEFIKKRGVKVVKSDYNNFRALDGDYIPYQFAGSNAKTAVLDELDRAKQFDTEGVDNEAIRQQTGWFKGPDGKWRFEISDDGAVMLGTVNDLKAKREADNEKLMKKVSRLQKKKEGLLPKVRKGEISEEEYYASLDKIDKEMGDIYNNRAPLKVKDILQHDKLFAAYPEIAEINVYISDNIEPNSAYFSKMGRSITVGTDVAKADANSLELKGVIMHEIQHAIQDNEGFATGGSPEHVNNIKRILELNAEASEEMERIEFFNKKLGSEEKTKELLHKEYLANKALRDSLDKTGDFSDEAMKTNDDFLEFIEELGLTKEDMVASYNTPSKKLYNDVRAADAYNVYWRLYGEVEARNTAKRSEFSDKLRKEISPERTQDVTNADAIVMFSDGTAVPYNAYNLSKKDYVLDGFDNTKSGNAFVKSRSGNIAHGIINQDIARQANIHAGEIRVFNSLYKHLAKVKRGETISRLEQIKRLGYDNPIDFIDDVMENLSKIQEGSGGSLLLTSNVGINNTVAIKLEQDRGFYRVATLMPRRRIGNKKTIWEAALPLQNNSEQPAIIGPDGTLNISPNEQNVNRVNFQSAFAGSRVDYDKPSLEAIGSGEGAQVHGWGLYYALSKDVAESYRETFVGENQVGYAEEWAYKGKTINSKFYDVTGRGIHDQVWSDIMAGSYGVDLKKKVTEIVEQYKSRLDTWQEVVKDKDLSETRRNNMLDEIEYIKELYEYAKSINVSELKITNKGQVHEVDIPENPYLLDEDLLFNEQSEHVKDRLFMALQDDAFSEYFEDWGGAEEFAKEELEEYEAGYYGGSIYRRISNLLGSDKAASQLLEEYDIKGITYVGATDGRCFVIFNPDDVKVIQKFYQDGANDPKGAYVNRIIHLFQNADASTLPHELAHFWKDTLKDAAKISKRAAKMLEDVEKWAEQEFNRKYSVQLKDGRYVVNNKQGLTVYDHNFRTEADAKEYAKEELFAQGNEAYLREGVAPNNSLKQAFRNFLNWLKHIYNQARQLDIRLSPEIRQVYADILGGTEIDFFLNTDPDTFVENRIKLATETVKTLDEQIAEAQRMGVSVSEPDGRGLKHVWETAMIPLSTRLGRVSNKLKNRLRRYEFDIANSLNRYYDEARPFLQKWKTFSEMDTIAFDIALKNDYVKKQLEIVDKYGAREEWEKVRKLLLDIFDSAVKAGLDVNFRPDYFPRKVKDVQGFLSYLRGRPEWTKFEEALRDADPDHTFTAEEQAYFINKYLRGFVKVDLMPYKYGSEKQRSIEIINNEMNKYYAPSMESLVSYIEGMNARIEASKFLGRDAENLDASVGGYLDYLINNKELDPNKVDEVKEILKARFNQKGVGNKWIAGARNISYMYTMGGINSAITQIEDLSVSMYKAGIWNTLTTAFENKKIKRADLGLDKISAEFVENPSRTAKGVDKLFKLTGLDKIDSFGKETLVNAMVKKFKQMSEESLRQYIEPIMEQETTQTIQDIKNGEMSDNVLYLVFSELSDVQPISLSELPAFYNTSGNLRILYMLKSFMIKRIDIFRNECFDKLRSKSKEARIQGMQNLFRLALLMIFCGVSKDWLINLLYGRKMDIPETVVNNALGLVGFSKFHAYQLRDKGAGEVIKDFLMPPMFAPYDDLIGDVVRIARGKRDLKDAESFKGVPLVGRFYYWHIGRGKEKMKKRNKSKLK